MNTAVFGAYRPNPTFQHVPPIQIVPAVYATVAGDVIQLAVESDNNAIGQTSSLKGTSTEGALQLVGPRISQRGDGIYTYPTVHRIGESLAVGRMDVEWL
jgi:hypothetical protein